MTQDGGKPVAVVVGTPADDPPPGIGAVVDVLDLRFATDTPSLRGALPGAEVLFSWRTSPGRLAEAWDAATELRWIQSASAGVDTLLFPDLVDGDVDVTNARGIFDGAIAEWVVGAMLAFTSGLHRSIVDQQRSRWDPHRHTERLSGARLVIAGPGPIGRGAGERALGLGMDVTLVGRTARDDAIFGHVQGAEHLLEAVGTADFVLDALPLTTATRALFGAEAFAAMKPTARFLNVGRGATVDEAALIGALKSGDIAGAALDVFATEPLPPDNPLWTLPTVVVSPHISGDVEGWERAVVELFIRNARRWVAGEPLVNLIDKRAGHG
jgi:phosphoglycerate dehydrogenase-like enzyme